MDSVIGLSDGLTVPFALTAGLSSLGESKLVILGGFAELIAGAISMGIGGFLASQAEFTGVLLEDKQTFRPYTPDEIRRWLAMFIRRFFSQQFKRSCLPDGPKVGSISLSPRGDWRMPSDGSATLWLEWAARQG